MMAWVRFNGDFSEDIAVNNGLRQGSSISPVLFNLYFALLLERWRAVLQQQCPAEQFHFLYNMSGRLYPRARTQSTKAPCSDLEFADDAGLSATSRASAQMSLELFHTVSSAFGLTFQGIKGMLHFVDNSALPEGNKVAKVEPLYDDLNAKLVQFGMLHPLLSIDESMVPYYG